MLVFKTRDTSRIFVVLNEFSNRIQLFDEQAQAFLWERSCGYDNDMRSSKYNTNGTEYEQILSSEPTNLCPERQQRSESRTASEVARSRFAKPHLTDEATLEIQYSQKED